MIVGMVGITVGGELLGIARKTMIITIKQAMAITGSLYFFPDTGGACKGTGSFGGGPDGENTGGDGGVTGGGGASGL